MRFLSLLAAAGLATCLVAPAPAADAVGGGGAATVDKTSPDKRPFLGIRVETTADGRGVRVVHTVHNTTSEKLGMRVGDVLLSIDGKRIDTREDLKAALAGLQVDQQVTAKVRRAGQEVELQGPMLPFPSNRTVTEAINDQRQLLDATRTAVRGEHGRQASLAQSLTSLSEALKELPVKLDVVAKEFKQVYPEGEFSVQLQINIRTTKDGAVLSLSPGGDLTPMLPETKGAAAPAAAENED